MKRVRSLNQQGFTVPELLVAVVVFVGLCVGSYYLLQPKSFNVQERDAQRMLGVAKIMQGISSYYADNGQLPSAITGDKKVIGSDKTSANICKDLVPKYMKDLPLDPAWGLETASGNCASKDQQYITSYLVNTADNGAVIEVSAPMAEGSAIHIRRTLQ